MLGDSKGAVQDYSEAIRLEPAGRFHLTGRALARMRNGDLPGALEDLGTAILRGWDLSEAHLMRAKLRSNSGDLPGALRDCKAVISLNPKEPDGYSAMGDVLFAMGHLGASKEAHAAALRLRNGKLQGEGTPDILIS